MKGIILAGGSGSRLFPTTLVVNKQLLPVYDKPMIYYPLSTLMLAGIKDVLIISTSAARPQFENLLGDGSKWGMKIDYATQEKPRGLPEAFIIGEKFIGNDSVTLILGDNLFYGDKISTLLQATSDLKEGGKVFAYYVKNPQDYGVAEFDKSGKVTAIVEKPKEPKSNFALCGIYVFDKTVSAIAKNLKPSARGEIEIVDVMNAYRAQGKLHVSVLGRGVAWLDTGTHDSLLQASLFVQTVEARQGLKIGCPEEVAFRMKFINSSQLQKLSESLGATEYANYLKRLSVE